MHINPALRVFDRGPSSVQVGVEAGLVLDGLTAGDRALIAALGEDREVTELVEIGRRLGVDERRVGALIEALGPVLLPTRGGAAGLRADRLAGELSRLAVVHGGDAATLLRRRADAWVRVDGRGALATAVATGLARAGIGRLTVDDGPPVTAVEIAPDGFALTDLGSGRAAALRRVCRAVAPEADVEVRTRPGTSPPGAADLWVITSTGTLTVEEMTAVDRYDGAALPVLARESDVTIGPLVVPGSTACLGCRDRHRCDADPGWPLLRDEMTVGTARPVPSSSVVSAAAALAVVHALSYLDGAHRPVCWSAEVTLRPEDGWVSRRVCHPHPDCLCGGSTGPVSSGPVSRGPVSTGPVSTGPGTTDRGEIRPRSSALTGGR